MKKRFLIFFLLSTCLSAFSQKRQNVYYIKNGIPVQDKESAEFRRIIQEPDSGSTLYQLFEFYPNNIEKTVAQVSKFEPALVYEGVVSLYNKQGILIEKSNYKSGKLIGEAQYFYDNGKQKKTIIYEASIKTASGQEQTVYKLINYYDSLGNQKVKEGNGYYKEEKDNDTEEGNYVNGNKDGVWKGNIKEDTYEEVYQEGKFVSGTAKFSNGKTSKYTVANETPTYPGGISEFYKYLSKEFKYPKEAVNSGINAKLYISFVLDKNGVLSDITFKNRFGYGIEEEAYRIFKNSPTWNPGKQHGIPVRVIYNIPINLKVN